MSFKAGSFSSMLVFLSNQHRVHPHVSWVAGSIVWDIPKLVRDLGRQGHRWAGVGASRGHLCLGVLAVVSPILGNVVGLQVRVFLAAVRAIL